MHLFIADFILSPAQWIGLNSNFPFPIIIMVMMMMLHHDDDDDMMRMPSKCRVASVAEWLEWPPHDGWPYGNGRMDTEKEHTQ